MRKILIMIFACIGIVDFAFADTTDITCNAGYYLPANSTTCTICPGDSYCGGGTYTFNETTAQGATKCPNGYDYNTNTGKTSVTQCQIHCDAGTYVDGYTRLEYIESTGTQWIDTDVSGLGSGDWEIYLKWMPFAVTNPGYNLFFGTYTNEQTNTYRIIYNQSQTSYLPYGNTQASNGYLGIVNNVALGTIHEVLIGNGYAYFDNARYVGARKGETIPDTTTIKINDGAKMKGRFYASWATKNGVYKYNFIPARRNSDGAIGMYDTVTETFFGNSGTGTFVAGPDINDGHCTDVGPGYYAGASTINYGSVGTKTACPIGTYSDITNGTSIAACKSCTGATYGDTTALASCKACPSGCDYNTDAGKTSATQCQIHCDAGTYAGYTQLEYIESTGTQYIDTGIYPDGLIRMKAKIETLRNNGTNSAFSGVIHNGFAGIWQIIYPYNGVDFNVSREEIIFSQSYVGIQDFDVDQVNKKIEFNGFTKAMNNTPLAVKPGHSNIPLCRYKNEINPSSNYWYGKVYFVKIWDNNILVRDFIPARRRSDGAIGMYDKVSGTFFTNSGTGTFTAGPDVATCIDVGLGYYAGASTINYGSAGTKTACPIGMYSDITNGAACKSCTGATYGDTTASASCKACPAGYDYNTDTGKTSATQCQIHCDAGTYVDGYTQLEYIESTGTQYIDTGIKPTDETKTQVTFKYNVLSGSDSIFAVLQSNGINYYGLGLANGGTQWRLWYGSDGAPWVIFGTPDTQKHTALLSDRIIYIDGIASATSTLSAGTNVRNMFLFGANFGGLYTPSRANIYSCKIWENNVLVRDFVPVRRNSDGEIGMYDTVTETFFGNSGTGTFVAGPDMDTWFPGDSCALCPENSYCPGKTLNYGATTSNGITACATGLFAPAGMWESAQCGRILHVGDGFVYLRATKKTSPSLHLDLDHDGVADYFGSMTTLDVPMSRETQRKLKVRWDNTTYSIYDDSVDLSQYQN